VTADIARARREATVLITQNEIIAAPVPVERIARRMGAQIRYAPLDGDLSGMATITSGVCIIGVNSLHPPHRQRFTLAHELGHLQLHRDILEDQVHLDRGSLRRDWLSSQGLDDREIEANAFASEILVPTEILAETLGGRAIDFEDEDEVGVLARKFRVSPAAMRYRLIRASSVNWG
jgi:Zn-dependent peptidase ImmA (M78 family)